MKKIVTILCVFLSLLWACRETPSPTPTDPCIGRSCPSDQICNNGICSCIKGQNFYGRCYTSDTSFVAYGKSNIWGDTILMLIDASASTSRFYKFYIESMDKTKHYIPTGLKTSYAYRIQDAQGDSLAPYLSKNSSHYYFLPGLEILYPEFKGRFLDSNTIRLQVTFCSLYDDSRIRYRKDSTTYTFRKVK